VPGMTGEFPVLRAMLDRIEKSGYESHTILIADEYDRFGNVLGAKAQVIHLFALVQHEL